MVWEWNSLCFLSVKNKLFQQHIQYALNSKQFDEGRPGLPTHNRSGRIHIYVQIS